jgi:hypothetical protein
MNQDITFSARADVSGQNDQIALPWLPVAGRTYRPLIKSGRWRMIRTARCCEGFPVYR